VKGEVRGAGFKGLGDLAMTGVSCDVCHSVSGHTHWETPYHQPGNGSLILSPGKDTVSGAVLTKYGPANTRYVPRKTENGVAAGFHECTESPLHLSSELCASCHQIYHYKTDTPLESTYTEWKNGPYRVNNIQCQDCHMVDNETFKRSADEFKKPSRNEYHHYFNGANFLLYYLNELAAKRSGDGKQAENALQKYEMAVARLQSAGAIEVVPVYDKGRLSEIKVRVKNIRAGHNLPTSLSTIRQMWLEVTVKDEGGQVLSTSGTIGGKTGLPRNTRVFNSKGQSRDFKETIDPWEITSFARHSTIPPRGYRDVYYPVPSLAVTTGATGGLNTATGRLTFEVKLRYRQADQEVAEKLLGLLPEDINLEEIYGIKEIPPLPIIDMVETTVVLNSTEP
jgi:Zn-finger protein